MFPPGDWKLKAVMSPNVNILSSDVNSYCAFLVYNSYCVFLVDKDGMKLTIQLLPAAIRNQSWPKTGSIEQHQQAENLKVKK